MRFVAEDTKITSRKEKASIPLQVWTGPKVPWKLSLPDFKTIGT